jgi:tRNA isopentenyl-2-thiomethyl-A-37 hydroxylase MiaE
MLEKIKKFVKSISSTTWMIIAVGVAAFVVLSLSNCHGKAVQVKPAVTEAPAAQ